MLFCRQKMPVVKDMKIGQDSSVLLFHTGHLYCTIRSLSPSTYEAHVSVSKEKFH